jgi:hypothetical protein
MALVLLTLLNFSWQSANASGATITVLVGDKDCFGIGGVCSDGDHFFTDLGGIFGDNRDPGEPLGVDQFGTSVPLGGPSFTLDLDLGGATPTTASIELFTAGIELVGATFYFNGTNIGFYTEPDGMENRAATVNFDVPVALLTTENVLTLSVPDLGMVQDGFVIDYVELSVEIAGPTFPFEATYAFAGGSIYGHLPVPQVNGFDYYFTPVMIDTAILGDGVTIESVEVSAFGQNNGAVVNFDWEVHIGPMSFGLPEGQFVQTLIDPAAGYTRIAPTQFRFVIGNQIDDQNYLFSAQHDFITAHTIASPYFSLVKATTTSPMNLTDGLYAQIFLWTADNRNSQIDFSEINLTVRGQMPFRPVDIDIKPGTDPNSVNLRANGKIPVAILTTDTFDATQVDWESVLFGPEGATEVHERIHIDDVDDDGDMDVVLHFVTQNAGIACSDTKATLTGETFSGESFVGTDTIETLNCL